VTDERKQLNLHQKWNISADTQECWEYRDYQKSKGDFNQSS